MNPQAAKKLPIQAYIEWNQCMNWEQVQRWHKQHTPWITDMTTLRQYYQKKSLDFDQHHQELISELQLAIEGYKKEADEYIKKDRKELELLKNRIDCWDGKQLEESKLEELYDGIKLFEQNLSQQEINSQKVSSISDQLNPVCDKKIFDMCENNMSQIKLETPEQIQQQLNGQRILKAQQLSFE